MDISNYSHEKLLMLASELKNENIKAYQISKDEQFRLDYFESRIKSVILPFIKARIRSSKIKGIIFTFHAKLDDHDSQLTARNITINQNSTDYQNESL